MYDIIIIGGGVVGALCAEALSKYDAKILLLEASYDLAAGATGANSGIVHAGFDAKTGSLKAKFNVRGAELMPALCKRLGAGYKNNGSLVIGFSGDEEQLAELYARGVENGVKELALLGKEELHKIEPNVSPDAVAALYAPTAGIVCPYSLAIAAAGVAMDNGTELEYNCRVTGIEKTEKGYKVGCENGKFFETKYIINCAGLHSDDIAALVGDTSFTVTPRRGEYILLDRTQGGTVSHTVFVCPSAMGKGILVSPTFDGNLILGPTSENVTDKEDKKTTYEGLQKVLEGARRSVPGVRAAAITSFTGLRAVGSTGDFIIRKSADNFLTFAGIESPGLSSAPALAEYAEQTLLSDGAVSKKKDCYKTERRPAKFMSELSFDEKNEYIKKDPAYGRIVCRCEEVTEGEIRDALINNPPAKTLDAVKRRVRAGMGRCQGGFCSPVVIGMIADRLGIPYERVEKCGEGSYITTGRTKGDVK
jgi:glycerol-3-phosphate dehydrogenase